MSATKPLPMPTFDGALNLGARWGVSDSDAQILYFAASVAVTLALVVVTVYYAMQNRRMADEMRRQRQLALFEPRIAVFRGVRKALGHSLAAGRVPMDTIGGLLEATADKEFLFPNEICTYLDDLYKKCVHAWTLHEEAQGLPVGGAERAKLIADESDLVRWILEQPLAMRQLFKPYLQVDKEE